MAFTRNKGVGKRIGEALSGAGQAIGAGVKMIQEDRNFQLERQKADAALAHFAQQREQLAQEMSIKKAQAYDMAQNKVGDIFTSAALSEDPKASIELNTDRLNNWTALTGKPIDITQATQTAINLKKTLGTQLTQLSSAMATLGSPNSSEAAAKSAYEVVKATLPTIRGQAPGLMEQWAAKEDVADKMYHERFKASSELANAQALAQSKAALAGPKLTPGQEALDKDFGKEYSDYIAQGGSTGVEKNLKQLDLSIESLRKDPSLTGSIRGAIPKSIRSITNSKAVATMQQAQETVTRNLRQVYGPQFTETEGKRLMEFTFDPQQPPKELVKRLERLKTQIKDQAEKKMSASKYFEDHGTLSGFKGTSQTMQSETVDVISPSGKRVSIPRSALEDALNHGGKLAQ